MPPIVLINGNRSVLKEQDRSVIALSVARRQLSKILAVLDDAVRGKKFLIDSQLSAADIMGAVMSAMALRSPKWSASFPMSQKPYTTGSTASPTRPAYQRTLAGGFG